MQRWRFSTRPCSILVGTMRRSVWILACLAFINAATVVSAQTHAPAPGAEARAARAYQAAAQAGPLALSAFLDQFPKGADLHVHLSGAVYAESFIRDAGQDGLCVDPAALSFAKPPCTPPLVEAARVPADQKLYDRLVNAFSMRSFVATEGFSGH